MSNYYEETFKNVEECLKETNYNIVAKNISGSFNGFFCERLSNNCKFYIKIRIDENINFLITEIYPAISVPKPFRAAAAEFCAKVSNMHKVGNMCIDPDYGNFYWKIETSFEYGAVPSDTIEQILGLSTVAVIRFYPEMENIARGILPKSENEEHDSDLISRMLADMDADDDEAISAMINKLDEEIGKLIEEESIDGSAEELENETDGDM